MKNKFTKHAKLRMAQRAICEDLIELTLRLGREVYAKGAVIVLVGHREVAELQGIFPEIRELEGLHVVLDRSGAIVTAYRNRERIYRKRRRRRRK